MNRTLELRARVTALSSISHGGGQSYGITSKFRRERFVQPDGTVEEVPVISGNALRGMLRDRGMAHMCRSLGYGEAGEGLSLAAYHFLFSGGALSDQAGRALDVDRARSLRRMIPLVGLFGGGVGNMLLPGKLKIDKMIPVCRETLHLLPEAYHIATPASIWDYLQEEMYTRKDDEKNEHLRQMLAPDVRGLLDDASAVRRLLPSDAPLEEKPGSKQQMMYYVETLAAGTPFAWSIVLDDATDAEMEAFAVALAEWSRLPYLGAKSNVGLGKVAIDILDFCVVDSRLQSKGEEIAMPKGEAYFRHLRDQGAAIRDLLRDF